MSLFKGKSSADGSTAETNASAASTAAVDVLTQQLSGDDIPEKFKGKTVNDLLQIFADTERKRTLAEQEAKQWRDIVETGENAPRQDPKGTQQRSDETFLDYLEEDAAKAFNAEIDRRMAPVVNALGTMQRDYMKETREDFDTYSKRADEIFANMKSEHKVHPEYGYTFAYRLAKAEEEDRPKKPAPTPPADTTKATDKKKKDELSPEQEKHMKMMGMTEETYRKYMNVYDPVSEELKDGRRT